MRHHVYSTLTNDNCYTRWVEGGGDMPILDKKVLIKGGTNVANDRFVTPMGVLTTIDDEELAVMLADPVFQMHEKNGFIRIEKSKTDPEKVAADMTTRDKSAPLVPEDFQGEVKGAAVIANTKRH